MIRGYHVEKFGESTPTLEGYIYIDFDMPCGSGFQEGEDYLIHLLKKKGFLPKEIPDKDIFVLSFTDDLGKVCRVNVDKIIGPGPEDIEPLLELIADGEDIW